MNSLSIIIPTIGRPTLRRTLESIACQMSKDDEVLLIIDGLNADLGEVIDASRKYWSFRWLNTREPASCYGHAQRNIGLREATKHYVTFCGDDDVYDQDAFQKIRIAIATNPGRPLIFKVDTWSCGEVWREPVLECGNVDCGGFVVPNDKERLGTFSYRYEGDYDFINGTLRGYPEGPVWRPERIMVCRPERYNASR